MRKLFWLIFFISSLAWARSEWTSAALVGDGGQDNPLIDQLRQTIGSLEIQNVILLGDNLYNPHKTYEQIWNPWKDMGFRFPVVAIGNHLRTYEEEMRYFQLQSEFYSVKTPGARFIVLNSDHLETTSQQVSWLEKEIQSAREPLLFVVFHHPPITLSPRHTWEEKKAFQVPVRQILYNYRQRISAVFVGHDHLASFIDMEGIPLIVSGSSFESFPGRILNGFEGLFHVQTHWLSQVGEYYWTRLDFNSQTAEAWINFVRFSPSKKVKCSIRINPKPWVFQNECARGGNSGRGLLFSPR